MLGLSARVKVPYVSTRRYFAQLGVFVGVASAAAYSGMVNVNNCVKCMPTSNHTPKTSIQCAHHDLAECRTPAVVQNPPSLATSSLPGLYRERLELCVKKYCY